MNNQTILIVDDNPTNLKLVFNVLEWEGYQLLKAVDAEDALEMIQRLPPDLILMDIALPGMDGLTLTRMLKADEKTRHIVVVALTAFAMKGDEKKARDAGCDGYITKPINTRNLAGTLRPFLSPKSDRSAALVATGACS
jgi:CheY-like chemotaxis protein